MRALSRRFNALVHLAVWLALCFAPNALAVNVQLYQRVEESITNPTSFSNPFIDTELRLSVAAPSSRALGASFTWYGFHDGDGAGGQSGNTWKFRLLFDEPGSWTVSAGFYVPGTSTPNGPTQAFTYTVSSTKAAGEHGHLYVDGQNWRRLRHADGTPWVPFPFHGSMLLDRTQAQGRQWIDEHAARGVDAIAVRFHSEAWQLAGNPAQFHWLLSNGNRATSWPGSAGSFDYNRFDLASWRYNEQVLEYARAKGVKLSVWFGVSGLNPQYESYGPTDYPSNTSLGPKQRLFIRYFLARWAPYTTWWHWTVDSEYEETGSGALDRVRTFAAELDAKNPWKTLLTTHVLSNWTPAGAPELDFATLQRRVEDTDLGATSCRSFVTDNDGYGKPVFNGEGVWCLSNVTRARVATWAHLFAGGFSEIAHWPPTSGPTEQTSWGVTWDQLYLRHKEDVDEIGKTASFFNKTVGIDISRCVPDHARVTVTGGNLGLCLAQSGEQYYVWVDRGGSSVKLDLTGVSGAFSVTRYRVSALGSPTVLASISGGAVRELGATPTTGFGNEYLYVVKRASGASLTLTAPNGGETWSMNGVASVHWASSGAIANVKLELSTDGGASYGHVLFASTPNDGSQQITVPAVTSSQARIRVSDALDPGVNDVSDASFVIQAQADITPPSVSITSPGVDGQAVKGNVSVSGTAADGSGISQVQWQLDSTSGAWSPTSGTTNWSLTLSQPSDGAHTVYVRATDSASPSNTSAPVARTFVSDSTGPEITNVGAAPGSTSAVITWTTDELATSRVQWGTAPSSYTGDTGVAQANVASHAVTLTGLSPSTSYRYVVMSDDALGNSSVSAERAFTTSASVAISGTTAGSGKSYVWEVLEPGRLPYIDRTYTFSSVPASYVGLQYLRTANDDKGSSGSSFLSFEVNQDVTVYVAHDDRFTTKPSWLSGWVDTGLDLVSEGGTLSLFQRGFGAGTVTLGGNTAGGVAENSMYTVVVRAAHNQPPIAVASSSPPPPITCEVGERIDFFDGGSTDLDGQIVLWRWSFGDGSEPVTLGAPGAASHYFTRPGTYEVLLTVTDDGGLSDDADQTIRVTVTAPSSTNGADAGSSDGGADGGVARGVSGGCGCNPGGGSAGTMLVELLALAMALGARKNDTANRAK